MENFGVCGLNCDECPANIAWENNDDTLREKTAKEWAVKYNHPFTKEMINCVGCLKDGVHCGYCSKCSLRTCALQMGLKKCLDCREIETCPLRMDFEIQTGLQVFTKDQ
ncbi:MAG: DUF3795 domain-containing protein [Chlamydiota bacterium]